MNVKHDKEAVLFRGLKLFCTDGYNNLGIDKICKETGMTKGAFYNAFKSKEQFLLEAILLYGENNVKRIESDLDPDDRYSPFDQLHRFYINMIEAQPRANFVGCFINNIMSEMGIANEFIGAKATIEYEKFIDAIEPTVIKAQEKGEISNEHHPRAVTELLHATFYGVLTLVKSSQNVDQGVNTMNLIFHSLKINRNG